jgi:outer membrane protein assembly factor BamB
MGEVTNNGQWLQFRGGKSDNIDDSGIPLIDGWGSGEPEVLWEVQLGEGHAAPVVADGRVYLLDYHEIKKADALRCFSLETGEELWRRWYNVHIKRNHGISRTVPAISGDFVISVGPMGHVMCVNRLTGDFLWGLDLVKEYGAEIPFWYTGQCPLIRDGKVVLAPGGAALLIGVDCATGQVVWETPNPDGWKMSHSSVMPMEYQGTPMFVYAAIGGVCGVAASGDAAGQVLWKTNAFAPAVVAPSPVILDNGKVFITAGYGAGSMLFQLTPAGNGFAVEVLQNYKPKDGMASEQQTPIFYNGYIYSILPKDAGALRNQFVCTSASDCQTFLWTSGKTERFGLGPYLMADGKFFILNDDGTLSIARAGPRGFELLDKKQIIDGQDAWGPMALANGLLLLRDSKKMVCLDVRLKSSI